MGISRRRVVQLLVGYGLLGSAGYTLKLAVWPGSLSAGERDTLQVLLDTLIPADETPGALDLGVADALQREAASDIRYRRHLKAGCRWLARQAWLNHGSSFADLPAGTRDQILQKAADSKPTKLAYQFFHRLRDDAFRHYYAHPDSWQGLGFHRPPQPMGYPDYRDPPVQVSGR